jgi:hypothetical protein
MIGIRVIKAAQQGALNRKRIRLDMVNLAPGSFVDLSLNPHLLLLVGRDIVDEAGVRQVLHGHADGLMREVADFDGADVVGARPVYHNFFVNILTGWENCSKEFVLCCDMQIV